jgi:tetratricopeptide (TPR) repeat protein
VVDRDPKDNAARFKLAVTLRKMKKFEDAARELEKVEKADKDFPGLALERGLLFEEAGDVQKAIEAFKAALAKAPDDLDLQLRVGSAYVMIHRPDEAIPMLKKVLDKRANTAEAHHFMGRAHMLRGQAGDAEAMRHLKQAVELDPNRADFHFYLAWAANEQTPANLELARSEAEKALALDRSMAEAYWQRGVYSRRVGAVEDALKDLKKALELKPSLFAVHAALAETYEDKNDLAAASAEWAKAVTAAQKESSEMRYPYWHYRYGHILLEKGHAAEALKHLAPAFAIGDKMDPRPAWVFPLQFNLAEALRKTGKKDEAREHYKRFLNGAPHNHPDRPAAQQALQGL